MINIPMPHTLNKIAPRLGSGRAEGQLNATNSVLKFATEQCLSCADLSSVYFCFNQVLDKSSRASPNPSRNQPEKERLKTKRFAIDPDEFDANPVWLKALRRLKP